MSSEAVFSGASFNSANSAQAQPSRNAPEIALRLQVHTGEQQKVLTVPLSGRIVLGRADAEAEEQPDLDLAPYGAADYGTSRLHAALSYQGGTVYVEDLGSTNGTRINGALLEPQRPYRLRDGDELRLGRLCIDVYFPRSRR